MRKRVRKTDSVDEYLLPFGLYPPVLGERRSLTESILTPGDGGSGAKDDDQLQQQDRAGFVVTTSLRTQKEIPGSAVGSAIQVAPSGGGGGLNLPETFPYGLITLKGTVNPEGREGKK